MKTLKRLSCKSHRPNLIWNKKGITHQLFEFRILEDKVNIPHCTKWIKDRIPMSQAYWKRIYIDQIPQGRLHLYLDARGLQKGESFFCSPRIKDGEINTNPSNFNWTDDKLQILNKLCTVSTAAISSALHWWFCQQNPSYKLQTGTIALLGANEQNYKSTDQTNWILSNNNWKQLLCCNRIPRQLQQFPVQ